MASEIPLMHTHRKDRADHTATVSACRSTATLKTINQSRVSWEKYLHHDIGAGISHGKAACITVESHKVRPSQEPYS